MIFDKIENLEKYKIPYLKPVIEYIKNTDMLSLGCCKNTIDGDNLYVNIVDRVLTEEPTKWEVHEKYIDVHVMLSGKERICFSNDRFLTLVHRYSQESDSAIYEGNPTDTLSRVLSEGDVVVFLPGEIHMSNGPVNTKPSRKAIFKVLY